MANVMSLKKLRNNVTRSGFDLSNKNVFSAKVGELLPVKCIEVIPGDSFKIKTQHFTRTMPVNTAAYTRIKEYVDWFFVPANLLWSQFNTFVSQMGDNGQTAKSIVEKETINKQPILSAQSVIDYLTEVSNISEGNLNPLGYERAFLTCKLLNYLDYGRWSIEKEVNSIGNKYKVVGPAYNVELNPFPLLAYQKIYQDYFRNSQWEYSNPTCFNVDYLTNGGQIPVYALIKNIIQGKQFSPNMFDLRYCNWNKDYFMGLQPSSQYGSVTMVNSAKPLIPNQTIAVVANNNLTTGFSNVQPNLSNLRTLVESLGFSVNKQLPYVDLFSILQLRQYEAKQKWAEITQSQQQDYKSQVEAHFNVSPDDAYSQRSIYVGGDSSNIDITEVVNTNLDSQSSVADIAGKGVGAGEGFVDFKADVHGYLICVYHAIPLLDYSITGISRTNLKTQVFDYAIPEFDRCGMVQVPTIELTSTADTPNIAGMLGFAPRYYDYKTSYDRVHGAFVDGGLDSWVAPFDDSYIQNYFKNFTLVNGPKGVINYNFFKVNPGVLNPIFMANADSTTTTDQLLINSYFDVKAVRPLDYDGLPY